MWQYSLPKFKYHYSVNNTRLEVKGLHEKSHIRKTISTSGALLIITVKVLQYSYVVYSITIKVVVWSLTDIAYMTSLNC